MFWKAWEGSFCPCFHLLYTSPREEGRLIWLWDLRKAYLVEPREFTWSFCTNETKVSLWMYTALWPQGFNRQYFYATQIYTSVPSLARAMWAILPLSWHPAQGIICTHVCILILELPAAKSIHFSLPLVLWVSTPGSRFKGRVPEAGLSPLCAWQVWGRWPSPLWKGGCSANLAWLPGSRNLNLGKE